jgi:hypothetical protein
MTKILSSDTPVHHPMTRTPTDARLADPPAVLATWTLTLRFALELVALFAIGAGARHVVGRGALGWGSGIAAAVVAATVWGVFGVPGDTRGNGRSPISVAGWTRVAIEAAVLCAGAAALGVMQRWTWFAALAAAIVVDHAGMMPRLRWLLRQR